MIEIRRAATFGCLTDAGVTLRCHFAFRTCADAGRVHWGRLRVVNVATMEAGATFALGAEENTEILTWTGARALHFTGPGFAPATLPPGSLQALGTGDGVNGLAWRAGAQGGGFVQFWFLPDDEGGNPEAEVREACPAQEDGGFRILASGFPEDDPEEEADITDGAPLTIRASSRLLDATLRAGEGAAYATVPGRALYLLVVSGQVAVDGQVLGAGDAAAISACTSLEVTAREVAYVMLADVGV
ncbi:pirin family protein [Gluconacetobacter entanii]|uniref:pirin family protein n=2 Tax=Gluconacetobacter entanii TaxID=108528 RepID=UPI00187B4F57|nr:hypothetical protein [Gluconacetobacter entanii]MBE7619365.1 hypothetical protein [Komagataeibacter sp. FXV2]MCW4579799.1 hypothetical protein [Gluconacetobacter entanii]MCW4583205.1 hypothetical protein [Gluconacetobacter entanii]MCW4586633.1 hypothetical protein [Gluconacetobacter entanii]